MAWLGIIAVRDIFLLYPKILYAYTPVSFPLYVLSILKITECQTMGYVENNLVKDESITYRARLHWIVLFWPAVACVIFGLPGLFMTGGALFSSDKESGVILGLGLAELVIASLVVGFGVLRMKSAEFAITNKRVILKYGVINRRTAEMFLQKVESVGVDQNLFGRMFDYGTVTVRGTGGTLEPFTKVSHALEFRRQVQERISELPGMQNAVAVVT